METVERARLVEFEEYAFTKLSRKRLPFYPDLVSPAYKASVELTPQYDLGIEIASGGLFLGYMFQPQGLPVKTVDMKRKGLGATWKPLDFLNREDVYGKRILIFDDDVVTGKTLTRATKELNIYRPRHIDLLLVHGATPVRVRDLIKSGREAYIKAIKDSMRRPPVNIRETAQGIEVDYYIASDSSPRTVKFPNGGFLAVDTRRNVPNGIRKTMTLKDFFQPSLENYMLE